MNLLRFLKSTKGAIKMANMSLVASVAAAGVFYVGANTVANRQIAAERAVRTLSSMSQTAPQEGMHRRGGMLTSINVRDGRNQLATAEERAAMEGNSALDRYNANQRALNNMESTLGRAAQFADSDVSLNTGNRDVVQDAARFSVGNPNAIGADVTNTYVSSAQGASASEGGNQNQLAPASMAHASGSSFNASAGPISGGNGARGAASGGAATRGGEGYRLSGAMPGGSNVVSQMGLDGASARANTASFGRDRNGRGTRGRNVGNERDELKDILRKSAAADANAHASANEGGRAFLANAQSSGGVTVDSAGAVETASSADLSAKTAAKLKAVGNRLKQEENKQEERNRKHRQLISQLILTTLFSVGAILAASQILKHYDDMIRDWLLGTGGAPWGYSRWLYLTTMRWLIAGAFIAAVTVANGMLFAAAKNFIADYGNMGGTWIATAAQFIAPIAVGAMIQTAIQPDWAKFFKNMWANFSGSFVNIGLGMFK